MNHHYTIQIPINEAKEIKQKLLGRYGKKYLNKLRLKYVKYYQLQYFLATGKDVHNGRIIKRAKFLVADVKHKKNNLYNATKEISDFYLAELSDRLEVRYKDRRYYRMLHRELIDRGHKFSYHAVWRLFNTWKDTSGGQLLGIIEEIVNSK